MRKKIMIMMCSLLFTMPVLSFAEEKKGPIPNVSAYGQANENAKFKYNRDLFNNNANKKIRIERLSEKEAAEAKKKVEEAQDKGEGQVKMKF